jgi:hypothetical protein
MPARHTSPKKPVCFSKQIQIGWLWSTKEGVGETSGQTAGSYFGSDALSKEEFALSKTGPAGETSFLRSVRVPLPRSFTGPKAQVKSDPDVFADALVPRNAFVPIAASLAPGAFDFPNHFLTCRRGPFRFRLAIARSARHTPRECGVLRTLQLPASTSTASEYRIVRCSPSSVRRKRDRLPVMTAATLLRWLSFREAAG